MRSSTEAGRLAAPHRDPRRRSSANHSMLRLHLEQLEARQLLAITELVPAIVGTVFQDLDDNAAADPGEELSGVTIELFQDDGDAVFEPGTNDAQVATMVTDASGNYIFESLDGMAMYFVRQPAQTVGSRTLAALVSPLLTPGEPDLVIDEFATTQTAVASPPPPSSDGSTLQFTDETEVLGRERDMFTQLVAGDSELELRVNPFGMLAVLSFNSAAGVSGTSLVTWDGIDNDPNPTPSLGLSGRDLTQQDQLTGIAMQLGIDAAGAGNEITIRLYQGSTGSFSESSVAIPVTDGTATGFAYLPFSGFTGPVQPTNVDAIQMIIGDRASADGQIDFIAVVGPKVADFANPAGTDLTITKTNHQTEVVPGESITYQIVVTNLGPDDVTGATVMDTFPDELESVTFTSTTTGTVSGNTTSGTVEIMDTVNMTAGSTITYTVMATVASSATGTLTNTAIVTPPSGIIDLDPSNNSATDQDSLTPEADLSVTKTDGQTAVDPGDTITYTITVTNNGPSDVTGALVTDAFPAHLESVAYSSTTTGTVSGNTSGSGNINDTVNMAAGSTITYTVTATVADTASGSLSNTVTITAPSGTSDPDQDNNTSTDVNTVNVVADLSITKTDGVSSIAPGQPVTYTITVTNNGPQDISGATIADLFPAELTGVSFTSSTSGTVSGNSASGTGNLSDTVDMAAGSSITYTVSATLSPSASGTLTNTATVTVPSPATDSNPSNNSATDQDNIVSQTVDLSVSKNDGQTTAVPGETLVYTLVVENRGTADVSGARVTDTFSSSLTDISFTSVATGGASGNTDAGTTTLDDTVDLPAGSSITYTVTATVQPSATGTLSNTATVAVPAGLSDANPSDNTDTDTDTLSPEADLSITKTNNANSVSPGGTTAYTIVVTNNGPSAVTQARVVDNFPTDLTNVSFTSTVVGNASGNSASGSGNIDDLVNLEPGSTITYTATATVAANATSPVVNTATVTAPASVPDPVSANDSATDTDPLDTVLARITGFVYIDLDNDGVRDPGERGIPGVTIILEQDDAEIDSATTDALGQYAFEELAAGQYVVRQQQPTGFQDGAESTESDLATVSANDEFTATLAAGDAATGLNFGEQIQRPTKRNLLASRFRSA